MSKKRTKHLFSKKHRDPKTGYCLTSLWGPFCELCRKNFEKKLKKAFKNIDIKEVLKNFKSKPKNIIQINATPIIPKNNEEEYKKHLIRERSKFIKY